MGPLVMYLISMKWLWNPHVKKLEKHIMGMDMHWFIEQVGKVDLKNWAKTITLEMANHDTKLEGIMNIHL
jgi:hypothetical protein